MIDTHCHLDFPEFQGQPGAIAGVLSRAAAAGVDGCITICTTTQGVSRLREIADTHPRVWFSAGVHPLYSDDGPHNWECLRSAAQHPKCVAFGELGLDNHYSEPTKAAQHEVLSAQLAYIEGLYRDGVSKPIVIHCREAFDDLLPILSTSSLPRNAYVFHCFTGTAAEARRVLDFGAMISFTGVVTYKNGQSVREAALLAPADRIMIETDAPFLSPEPHRNVRPCEPWLASITARAIADLRKVPLADFHEQINSNVSRFFGIK